MSNSDLLGRIRQKYLTLSKSHKKIADYILENYDKVAFMTASTLGKNVNISESTVVRFANAIGYEGYPQLQKELQETIKTKLTTVQRFELSKEHQEAEYLTKIMINDMDHIRQTIDQFDYDLIDKVIHEIINAKKVYILGLRSSSVLANYLGFYLNFILPEIHIIQESAQDVYDQLLNLSKDDVMVVLSFPRYSKRTYDCVNYAIKNRATIIGITDGMNSPLYEKVKYCLIAKYNMNTFIDSFVAPMSLINALIIGVSIRKEGVEKNLEKLERIWDDYGVYNIK
ncbi:MurR/RpiR family transcriptional regulator [Fusibacter sp. 3D3]|uniref:MurR/RpiR family transcriptional regulator n=1 Tax=Fusibacter sp. 3D3 TaxID=1048380 RepID=UPI000853B06C|nr:MurR/RpiR family transcriptional regulator [Fusibacter sp. 3D3]GAU76990.1 transcriptional regulator [Fusibacter sp. 3D3]